MPYPAFDRSRLQIKPLAERDHDLERLIKAKGLLAAEPSDPADPSGA